MVRQSPSPKTDAGSPVVFVDGRYSARQDFATRKGERTWSLKQSHAILRPSALMHF